MPRVILRFDGPFRFLSNFWPCQIDFEGITYKSSEAAYQAAKTLDTEQRKEIALLSPGGSKAAGRNLTLRPDWEEVKVKIMYVIVTEKFKNPDLRKMLMDTGDAYLVEGNTWGDCIWGVDLTKGVGDNMLGQILMKVRNEILEEEFKKLMRES